MTRHLLVLVLLLELLESETTNVTTKEPRDEDRNQTVTPLSRGNSTKQLYNSSWVDKDLRKVGEENRTSSQFVYEDDERFQEQEDYFLPHRCNYSMLYDYSYGHCGIFFFKNMESMRPEDRCVFQHFAWPYYNLSECLQKLSNLMGCFYPNPITHEFFQQVHTHYFSNCSREEELLVDAPEWAVVLMTLVPVTLIPLLVYLAIWKSKEFQSAPKL